jgi:hypothetical protein
MAARRLFLSPAFVVALLAVPPNLALAQTAFVVTNSNLFRVGEELSEATVVKLGKDDVLRIFDQKTNRTLTLIGPYEGKIANYRTNCNSGLGSCNDETSLVPGGSRGIRH